MSEAWTVIGTGAAVASTIIATRLALARLIIVQSRDMKGRIAGVDRKVDKLADDYNALARELSEVKGFLRGTLPESPPRAADKP